MTEINLRKTSGLNDVWSRGVRALLKISDKSRLSGHDNIADIWRLRQSSVDDTVRKICRDDKVFENPTNLLSTFVAWACSQQQELLLQGSTLVTKLQIGKATRNRSVTLTVERLRVEQSGWIGDELEEFGSLTVWENGCADAEWTNLSNVDGGFVEPNYQEHWDNLNHHMIGIAFQSFTAQFDGPTS